MFEKLWNWKKYPGSVFFIVIPLALAAFAAHTARAVYELRHHGDPWYAVILLCGLGLLVFGLWPLRKQMFRRSDEGY